MEQNFGLNYPQFSKDHLKIPISPQTFNIPQKIDSSASPKITIFAPLPKPKTPYDSFIDFQTFATTENISEPGYGQDLKKVLNAEMKKQFDKLKRELLETSSIMIQRRRDKEAIYDMEIEEMKRQVLMNKQKLEESQADISQVDDQYREVKTLSTGSKGEKSRSISPFLSPKSMNNDISRFYEAYSQSQTPKHKDNYDVHKGKNEQMKGKIIEEARKVQHYLESTLKHKLEAVNVKVKRLEDNVGEVTRRKRGNLDAIRENFTASIGHQGVVLNEEVKHLGNLIKLKCDQNKVKVVVSGELNEKTSILEQIIGQLKGLDGSVKEELTNTDNLIQKRLIPLENQVKSKKISPNNFKNENQINNKQKKIEENIQTLDKDIRSYQENIQQLRSQLKDVNQAYQILQNTTLTPNSQKIMERIKEKISLLQNEISTIESFIREQNSIKQSPNKEEVMKKRKDSETDSIVSNSSISRKKSYKGADDDKVFRQINLYIQKANRTSYGDESEICCYVDDEGYVYDEMNNFVVDEKGEKVKLTQRQVKRFNGCYLVEEGLKK